MRGCLADVMALGYWMVLGWLVYAVVKNAVLLIADGRKMKQLDKDVPGRDGRLTAMFGKKKKVTFYGRSYEQLEEAILWLSYLKEDIILGDEEADAVDAGREAIAGIMKAMTDRGKVKFDEA